MSSAKNTGAERLIEQPPQQELLAATAALIRYVRERYLLESRHFDFRTGDHSPARLSWDELREITGENKTKKPLTVLKKMGELLDELASQAALEDNAATQADAAGVENGGLAGS